MKHKFTQVGEARYSRCGHPYCSSDTCHTYYVMPDGSRKSFCTQRCSCGFEYSGEKNKQTELEHVLKAEGLYA